MARVAVGVAGKIVELQVSRLVEADQKFVKQWVEEIPPEDQLTVRIVASSRPPLSITTIMPSGTSSI